MTTPLPARVVAGLALALAGALPTQAAAAPIADTGTPSLPDFPGAAATAQKIKDPANRAAEPVHGARTRTRTSTTTPG